jgi:ABC-type polysaccharide/polyol phosphate transport system ATPase subunit
MPRNGQVDTIGGDGIVLDHVALDHVEKHYPAPLPPVFSRQERLSRLLGLLRRVFARPCGPDAATDGAVWRPALVDISLNIGAGTVLGICGERGSGKTTLLRILAGLERPTRGRVSVVGRAAGVFALTEGACHRQLSVRENILLTATRLRLGRDWLRQNLAAVAEYADLDTALKTPLGAVPREAYWRLAWALAVRSDPQVLLLDDMPIGDPLLADDVCREIASRRAAGRTVVLAGTQAAQLAPLCSQLVCLQQGRLVDCQPANDPMPAPVNEVESKVEVEGKVEGEGELEWYWVSSPQDGWGAYLRLAPANAQKRRAKGQRLIPARPPWLDAQGASPLEPWWPEPTRPTMATDEEFAHAALREDQEMEFA